MKHQTRFGGDTCPSSAGVLVGVRGFFFELWIWGVFGERKSLDGEKLLFLGLLHSGGMCPHKWELKVWICREEEVGNYPSVVQNEPVHKQ